MDQLLDTQSDDDELTAELGTQHKRRMGQIARTSHKSKLECSKKGDMSDLSSNCSCDGHSEDERAESGKYDASEGKCEGGRAGNHYHSSSHSERKKNRSDEREESSAGNRRTRKYPNSYLIKYLLKDACFFVIKSNNYENVSLSKAKGVWSTPAVNENKLNHAFVHFKNVLLIFSVKGSGKFQGQSLSKQLKYSLCNNPFHYSLS